jgi:hypothetical protein
MHTIVDRTHYGKQPESHKLQAASRSYTQWGIDIIFKIYLNAKATENAKGRKGLHSLLTTDYSLLPALLIAFCLLLFTTAIGLSVGVVFFVG